jgi:hypothetical protein
VLGVQSLFQLCCLLTIRDSYEQLCAGQGDASGKVNYDPCQCPASRNNLPRTGTALCYR